MAKKPKSASARGFGILNPFGDMWTHTIFESPREAQAYVKHFWNGNPNVGALTQFKIVRVRQSTFYVGDLQ
jgi:hypothetical protein